MCGIAGFFSFKEEHRSDFSKREIIGKMTEEIIHRGPDGNGFYIDELIALGMRRLSIIDLEKGWQPQYNEDKSIVIVFNGEIYNFLQLKQELIKKGHIFKTNSDTEVIVHLYEEEGIDFVKYLNGMFAIALYDKKQKTLILSRDRMGIKPLHYSIFENFIIFGSEIKSILKFPKFKKTIDPMSLYDFFTFEFISAPNSIYQNIKKILPGEMLIIKRGKIQKVKYWEPKIEKKDYEFEELKEKIKETFLSSVKYRLISDVPLGVFLSGGIDSTLITGVASQFVSKLKTFSIGFKEETFNELSYAKIASDFFKTDHTEMILSYNKVIELLPNIMNYLDEPLADASILPTYLVSYLSKQKITVALSGDGGDELFLGYDTYKAYKIAKYLRWIPKPIVNLGKELSSFLPASQKRISLEFKIKKFLSGLNYKPEISNYIWWGAYPPKLKKRLFTQDFLNLLKDYKDFSPINFYLKKLKNIKDPLDRINYLDLHLYLQDDLLPKVDRMSMATSLEVRVPFLDHRMVELALSIKNNLRMKGFKTKYILKESLKEFIPPPLFKRPKIGFDIPLGKWLRQELKDYMFSLLNERALKEHGFFNVNFIEEIINTHIKGKHNYRQLIWPLMIFQNWYKKYKPDLLF